MVTLVRGKSFKKTKNYFERLAELFHVGLLDKYGKHGVAALAAATPVDTGKTADSWTYKITRSPKGVSIVWTNDNFQNGYPVAILIQYGHATGWGAYVKGIDYINPAMKPIFEDIAKELWEEVKRH